jgi:hypothetical protein
MHGSAGTEAWLSKFNEKEEEIMEKLDKARELPDGTPLK